MLTKDVMRQDARSRLTPAWSRYTNIVVDHAQGIDVYSKDGRHFLDFTSGIGVTSTGHCHPTVVAAAQAQVARIIHSQINILYHEPMFDLAAELLTVVPEGLDEFFFSNSGAEGVEAAIKLARQATGRNNVIVFQGGFHGRTMGTMSLTTSNTIFRKGFGPLMPNIFVAPYPNPFRYGWGAEETAAFCIRELEFLLTTQSVPSDTAVMLLEPVQGEGGFVVPPPGFLEAVRAICDQHSILLAIDEVQSGFGRTGRWFAHQHYDVKPDIMVMAKGMASGFPLSGIAYRPGLMDNALPGSHGGTYGGNAVSCAAAAATIRVIREEGLVENSARVGAYLIARLQGLQGRYSAIGDVRGLGLMVAVEFVTPDGQPAPALVQKIRLECLERGLILITCGSYGQVIRWIPALVVNQEQIDQALAIFEEALQAAAG
jgi:4-aminobutyrate aminotransferase